MCDRGHKTLLGIYRNNLYVFIWVMVTWMYMYKCNILFKIYITLCNVYLNKKVKKSGEENGFQFWIY